MFDGEIGGLCAEALVVSAAAAYTLSILSEFLFLL
jgi:hypothetical protein